MGWFLPIRKRKSSAKRTRPAPQKSTTWDPNRTLAGMEALAAVGLLLVVLVGWHFSQTYFTRYLQAHQLPRIGAHQVDLVEAPTWMSPTTRQELQALVARNVSSDPMDNTSLEHACYALAGNPWVQSVVRIQRLPNARISVLACYREPVAAVQTSGGGAGGEDGAGAGGGGGGLRLVDIKGVCLPGVYPNEQAGQLGFPLITGVAQPAPTSGGHAWIPGQPWKGEDLQAGLSLIQLLRAEPYYRQALALDVGQRDARGRICLVIKTQNGAIVWGLPPGKEQAIEADAEIKMIRLADVYRRRGSIDTDSELDIYQVDAFSETPRIHRAPTEEHSLQVGYTWSK